MNKYEQAKKRIAEIDADIFRLSHERALIQQWLDDGDKLLSGVISSRATVIPLSESSLQDGGKRANSFKAKVIRTTEEILATQAAVATRDIIPVLESKGIEISGSNKVLTVAQVLSRQKDKFVSGSDGWSLKK